MPNLSGILHLLERPEDPAHQVFLRAYEFNAAGDPVATGKLIVNRNLGADGIFGTADDVVLGGMSTWGVV